MLNLPPKKIWQTQEGIPPKIKLLFFLFLLLQYCFFAHAHQYSFKNYTVAHGLGSSSINHIFQDSRGYIWFATQGGGASRFNGKEFKTYTKADGLINNDITYITEDKMGNVWIATAGGVSEFNGISFRNFSLSEGLTDGVVYAIYADALNKLWFATQDNGVKIFDRTTFDSLTIQNGLPSNEVYSIAQDASGNYWFGLSEGIAKYSNGEITSYHDSTLVKDKAFFTSLLDNNGNIWFGSTGGGVIIIQPDGNMRHLELPPPLENDFIGGMAQDKLGNFWLATDHGLLKYDGKEFKLFSEQEGLSTNIAQTVRCDYEGNIWAGTLDGGVNLLSSEAFVQYARKDDLANSNVTCIESEPGGKFYYIGTGDGLYIFTPESATPFKKASSIPEIENTNITAISVDDKKKLWVCTQDGVFVLEKQNGAFRLLKRYNSIAGERIISPTKIIHDSNGNCWVATYGSGAFCVSNPLSFGEERGEAKSCNTKNGFHSDKILTVFEDSKSNIWIGTQDAGIIKYDGSFFSPLPLVAEAGGEASVWSITEDDNGNIYWGTSESGLCRYDGKEITTYTSNDGLSSDYIIALVWDKIEHCLWLGSEKGLDKIKFTADYKIEKIHNYKEHEGFPSAGVNHNAMMIDADGILWLGTVNGLWQYDRNLDFPKNTSPKIQLTGIRLFYQKANWKKFADSIDNRTHLPAVLKLPYNKNHLTFDIQALTTQDVHYVFKLEGQDEEWSSPTRNNEITYSNISAGQQYTFKAKAVNSEGISSSETVLFSFTINPPWWSTWWFRSVLFLVVIGSLVAFIKAREKVLREQNLKLEEIVKLRTLEIEQQKEVVENNLEEKEGLLLEKEILLKEIHHRVKNNLQTISSMLMLQGAGLKDEQAKKAITESQSRVRSIALVHQKLYQTDGLEKVELNAFIKDLTDQVKSFYQQQSKQVSVNLEIPETFILIDTAIPLGLIMNELLTNSFKYAFNNKPNGEINIKLTNETSSIDQKSKRRKVTLIYRDNGYGLKSPDLIQSASTLGLRLVRLLSEQIGASLSYSNSNGSEFIFIFGLNV